MQKIEEGVVTLELARFDLRDVARRVLRSMRSRAVARSVHMSLSVPPNVPFAVLSDRFKIEHVTSPSLLIYCTLASGVEIVPFLSRPLLFTRPLPAAILLSLLSLCR